MATYYVSNLAVNGYVSGSNSNLGTSPGIAVATIDYAVNTLASIGDTILVNPTGTSYSENSGSNYLSLGKAVTVMTDPAYISVGKATITSPTIGGRVINLVSAGYTLQNLIIDCASASRNPISLQASSASQNTFSLLDFVNVPAAISCILGPTSNKSVNLIDKCTLLSSKGNAATSYLLGIPANSTINSSYTLSGNTLTSVGGLLTDSNIVAHSVNIQPSTDSTPNTVTNLSNAIQINMASAGTGLSLNIVGNVFNFQNIASGSNYICNDITQTYKGSIYSILFTGNSINLNNNTSTGNVMGFRLINGTSSLTASGNVWTGVSTGNLYGYYLASVNLNNVKVYKESVNLTGITFGDFFGASAIGSGCQVYNNTISTDFTTSANGAAHVIDVGGDGEQQILTNFISTGTQNLGDTTSTTWLAQPITWPAALGSFGGMNTLASVFTGIQKVGTPLGNITCSIYSYISATSVGSSMQLLSYETMSCSSLSASAMQVAFWDANRFQFTPSTNYFIVWHYIGTVDGSNYVQFQKNAGANSYLTSNGTGAWSTGSGQLIYVVTSKDLNCVNPQVYGNTITCTGTGASGLHGIIINGTDGATMYDNTVVGPGTSIAFIMKGVDGSVNTAICYNNMAQSSNTATNGVIYEKGSLDGIYSQNEVAITGSTSNLSGLFVFCDGGVQIAGLTAWNAKPSRNAIIKNNIFSNTATAGPMIWIGSTVTYLDTNVSGLTLNNNLVYGPNLTTWAKVDLAQTGITTPYTSFTLFQSGTNLDQQSVNGSPLFTNTTPAKASDFIVGLASPARGIGANMGGKSSRDYLGNLWPLYPDAGSYYIAGIPVTQTIPAKYVYNTLSQSSLSPYPSSTTTTISSTTYAPVPNVYAVSGAVTVVPVIGGFIYLKCNVSVGGFTVTLPDASTCNGLRVYCQKEDSSGNTLTLGTTNSQLINGGSTKTTTTQYAILSVISDGANWCTLS